MKKIALCGIVAAVAVASGALAQTPFAPQPTVVLLPNMPDGRNELRYPRAALRNHEEGACEVSFVVAADGVTVERGEVVSCSSPTFRAQAERYVRGLPGVSVRGRSPGEHAIRIEWRGRLAALGADGSIDPRSRL